MNGDQAAQIIFLLLIVVLFWTFIIRPARNRQREAAGLQNQLRVGQRVMLTSGIHGELAALDDDTMRLEVAPGTTITVHRQAVMKVLDDPAELADEPTEPVLDDETSGDEPDRLG